jgi:hypothetical protein
MSFLLFIQYSPLDSLTKRTSSQRSKYGGWIRFIILIAHKYPKSIAGSRCNSALYAILRCQARLKSGARVCCCRP